MEPIEVVTSQGYKVYIKPKITFGDYEAIQDYINSFMSYNVETNKPNPITISMLQAGNKKAFELLVVKVLLPDGTQAPNPLKAIYDFEPADGKLIKDKVDEIYESSKLPKKNEIN